MHNKHSLSQHLWIIVDLRTQAGSCISNIPSASLSPSSIQVLISEPTVRSRTNPVSQEYVATVPRGWFGVPAIEYEIIPLAMFRKGGHSMARSQHWKLWYTLVYYVHIIYMLHIVATAKLQGYMYTQGWAARAREVMLPYISNKLVEADIFHSFASLWAWKPQLEANFSRQNRHGDRIWDHSIGDVRQRRTFNGCKYKIKIQWRSQKMNRGVS